MKIFNKKIWMALLMCHISTIQWAQAPDLGSAGGFAIFTGVGAFTITGPSTVIGDAGTNAGIFTGFPPGTLIGQLHVQDIVSAQAATDVGLLYSDLSGRSCSNVIGVNLGNGQVLTPGVYCTGAASTLSGIMYLNAMNVPDAIFIIQVNGALATSNNATVALINGASSCNVFWQINGMLSLAGSTDFKGTAVVEGAVSLVGTSYIEGRILVTNGAINMDLGSFSPCMIGILPIHLVSFEAMVHNAEKFISLEWQTASEINNSHFLVEKSHDGITFERIVKIPAVGNLNSLTNYSFEDKTPYQGNSFYRLNQYDTDGSFCYSDIRSVVYGSGFIELNVYPNPFSGKFNIQLSSDVNSDNLVFEIYRSDGLFIHSYKLTNNNTEIKNLKMEAGYYFYVLKSENNFLKKGVLVSF
jgi:hypothetical protein